MALEQLGRFKLIEQIGKGSMGVVFRGQDTEFGRVVAIKVLSADMAAEEEGVARFRREALRQALRKNSQNKQRLVYVKLLVGKFSVSSRFPREQSARS